LLEELVKSKEISTTEHEEFQHLNVVGLVGSIDNDFADTDATIGCYSSLGRICEAVDYIDATAFSHQRAFVIEVMGRHCGWLALMAGVSTGADFIFIPENPPDQDWEAEMCSIIKKVHYMSTSCQAIIDGLLASVSRKAEDNRHSTHFLSFSLHFRLAHETCDMSLGSFTLKPRLELHHSYLIESSTDLVQVAEGAHDLDLTKISPTRVKDLLSTTLGLDTRITTLGHVQRGGNACAYDRQLSTLQGSEAVKAVLEATPETPSKFIAIIENKIVRNPLIEAVRSTAQVADAIKEKNFKRALELRGPGMPKRLARGVDIMSNDEQNSRNITVHI